MLNGIYLIAAQGHASSMWGHLFPIVPLVEPASQSNMAWPGQDDKVLECKVNSESYGISAAVSATAAALSSR